MSLFSLWVIAVGLSMDAFAVSICKGLGMPKFQWKNALKAGVYFGGFQALMPLLGFFIGVQFSEIIAQFDHWIAFILLSFIGVKMLREAKEDSEIEEQSDFGAKTMLTLAVATSIDALAIGISFAFLNVEIWAAALTIGMITALFSIIGVKGGHFLGSKLKTYAEIFGGIILILIGVKILIEHLS